MAQVADLVQQRHAATQTYADADGGDDVVVISTAYAKSFQCYARDSWKTITRRGGMKKKYLNPKYTHAYYYTQTDRIQGSSHAVGPFHRTASPSRAPPPIGEYSDGANLAVDDTTNDANELQCKICGARQRRFTPCCGVSRSRWDHANAADMLQRACHQK